MGTRLTSEPMQQLIGFIAVQSEALGKSEKIPVMSLRMLGEGKNPERI